MQAVAPYIIFMGNNPWEMWIDVGGTFTDCLAKSPDHRITRHKLLSSGKTQGALGPGSKINRLKDLQRCGEPDQFWTGFQCTLRDAARNELGVSIVTDFDSATGVLELQDAIHVQEAVSYELKCDLDSPLLGIRYLLGLPLSEKVPPLRLRLGTTHGTNALLTRTGARTALVTTRGHGDFLQIGYQDRPRLFELTIQKPAALIETVLEVDERMSADGNVLIAPKAAQIRDNLRQLYQQGIESLAICLLHADRYPAHEQLVAEMAQEVGFTQVSMSHVVAPLAKIVVRGETTVVDAYLSPVLKNYVQQLKKDLPSSQIRLMSSAGGLVAAAEFHGHQSVLSGPAGGVVGFARAASAAGFQRAIGFDMGGTSTDVSRFDATRSGGAFELQYESHKAGVRLMTPMLAIDTVAAGGGSICQFDGTKLRVGPSSAGADPGPACYGHGGPLTVTDLNLYLGRIASDHFPFPLDREAIERRLDEIARQVEA